MARPYHSPSSIALAERCERAWYHAYVDGIRSPGSVATELGGAVHKVGEAYYRRLTGAQAPDWASRAGQIFTSALHLLPDPRAVDAFPEEALGGPWCVPSTGVSRVLLRPGGDETSYGPDGCRDDSKPGRAIVVDGCRYAGFRDLVVVFISPDDAASIGAEHARINCILLVDYKSSSNVRRFGKTAEQLEQDFAANLYSIDVGAQFGIGLVPCRWPYISTGSRREAIPTDFTINTRRALEVVASRTPLVKRIDAFTRPEDAVCNTAACADYGGCSYHFSKGGPCKAQRKVSAFIMARSKGQVTMALTAEQQAKFDALKAKRAGAAAPTEIPPPPVEADEETQPDAGGPVEEEEPPPAPPARDTLPPTPVATPRKAKAPAAPKAAPVLSGASSEATPDKIAVLAALVAEAQADVNEILSRANGLAEAEARRDKAIADLRKALT